MIKPTKNPNLRTQPTCLRSRLYRLVEPLTIKPIGMTQLPVILKNAPLHLLKFLTCYFPNYPAPGFKSVMEMLFVSCVCLFSLLLVPVPADVRNGNLTEQRRMCNALGSEKTHTLSATAHSSGSKNFFLHYLQVVKLINDQHLTQLAGRFPAMLSCYHLRRPLKTRRALRETSANGPATDTTWIV